MRPERRRCRRLQRMEDRLHPPEGAQLPEADSPQLPAGLAEPVRQVLRLVGVRSQRQHPAAQIAVQLQNAPGGSQVLQTVLEAGGVQLNAPALRDGLSENLLDRKSVV